MSTISRSLLLVICCSLFAISSSAYAAMALNCNGPTIDALLPPYNAISNLQGSSVYTDDEVRNGWLTQAAAAYRRIGSSNALFG